MLGKICLSFVENSLRPFSGSVAMRLRRIYYRRILASCGRDLRIGPGVIVQNANHVHIGDNVWIDRNVTIIAGPAGHVDKTKVISVEPSAPQGQIHIGSNSHIGLNAVIQGHGGVRLGDAFTCSANCCIYSLSNDPSRCHDGTVGAPQTEVYYVESPVVIGRNVWLGLGVAAIGAKIGDDCFIRPGAVVVGAVEPNSVCEGFPATKTRDRFTQQNEPNTS